QVGRPDDGIDTTGFFNTEYFVDLKPKETWRSVFHGDKDALIAAMDRELGKTPGVLWNFSQPIADNMEEAVSGVKGELAVKIYGEGNSRYVALKYSVRGRDLGSTVHEAIEAVSRQVVLPPGYRIDWAGEYESQQRAQQRLFVVVPLTVMIILLILYTMFNSFK